ncbi:MAG: SIMPL domain-containing protein [Methanomicrobium sp.]|nr:SIMPL domain-containing protein [Methanomicrobium sp.]MBP5475733.1 SIMPL domain-containing protein [Methanomicrobium sp.]
MAQISRIYPVVLVMLIAAALTVGIASAAEPNEKVITVSGTGKVTTSPDTVIISVAVETENTDSQKAQKENADKMAQCINALKSIGITDSEMKTTGYTMYSYKSGSDSIFGGDKTIYHVRNTIQIKTSKIDLAGKIIDTATSNGANNVNSVRFTLSDEKSQEMRDSALKAAVAQARADADAVASAMGISIVGVYYVNVGSSYTPMVYAETAMYKSAAMATGSMDEAVRATPIESSDVDVTASVSVAYIIR